MGSTRLTACAIGFVALCAAAHAGANATAPRRTLTAFTSEQEISALFARWSEEHKRRTRDAERREAAGPPAAPQAQALSKAALGAAPRSGSSRSTAPAGCVIARRITCARTTTIRRAITRAA